MSAVAEIPDTICFMQSPTLRMTKLIRKNGTVELPEPAKKFNVREFPVSGLDDIHRLLSHGLKQPSVFAVRGALVGGPSRENITRRLHPDPISGAPATLVDVPRRWVALDMDGVPLPDGMDVKDLVGCAGVATLALPLEFLGVRAIAQATAGHGIKPGARLRLWFWLSRPVGNAELKLWLQGCEGVDHAVLNAAQPIYTAAPVLEDGRADHLPNRLAWLDGDAVVEVPAITVPTRLPRAVHGAEPAAGDAGDVAAALAVIPNPDSSWEDWAKVGMAAHAATGGDDAGFDAWSAWSAKSAKHDDGACAERWDHWDAAPATQLSFGTLAHLAQQAVPGWRAPSWSQSIVATPATEAFLSVMTPIPRPPATGAELMPAAVQFSEDSLALKFAAEFGDDMYFASELDGWLIWDGARYNKDARRQHLTRARMICRRESVRVPGDEAGLGRKVASAQAVAATAKLAACDPIFARCADDFDIDPWALNTPGGVVDLRTGAKRNHSRTDLFTKVTTVAPDLLGECPRWLQFMHEITQGDDELVAFLRRFLGYTLTGITRDHAFLFLYGPGGNGKSVLLNTVAEIIGDYTVAAMPDVFTVTQNDHHPTHVAALRGARLVSVSETEEGKRWAESRIKTFTAGDPMTARTMRGDPFQFTPHGKVILAGNHKPVLSNPDLAMLRRIHFVPLTYRPPAPDASLPDALRAEAGAILHWLIGGCLEWQQKGLQPPASVVNATAEYFEEQDSLAAWLAERCDATPVARTLSSDLYNAWSRWATDSGLSPRGAKWFTTAMERHYAKEKTRRGREFVGVVLKPPAVAMRADGGLPVGL